MFAIAFLVIPIVVKIINIHDSHLKTEDYAKSFKDEFFTTGKILGNIGSLLSLIASFLCLKRLNHIRKEEKPSLMTNDTTNNEKG